MRRATTFAPGRMRVDTAPDPQPLDGEALLEVQCVGLCGSDYHLFTGTSPYSTFPRTQGHEISGIIRALPDDYVGELGVGDLVAVEPLIACGECIACRRQRANCCSRLRVLGVHLSGGLSELMSAPVTSLYPVGTLDPILAAMVEPVSIGIQAVRRGGVTADDTVLVLGGGPIGLAATVAATAVGARVIVADRIASRLERARLAGAESTILNTDDDLTSRARVATDDEGPTIVIDATGDPTLIRTAVDVVAHGGTVVVVGVSSHVVDIPVVDLTRKELTLAGSRNSANVFPEAIELVRERADAVRGWVTHLVELDDVPEAIAFAIAHPELVEKIQVRVGHRGTEAAARLSP